MAQSPLASPELWDDLHEYYDHTLLPRFTLAAKRGLELVAPTRNCHIVDVACGPGTLSLLAAPQVKRVTAVDFAQKMVELLDAKKKALGLGNIDASVADGTALPFPDEHFDSAFSCFGLFLFSDRKEGFAELRRVTKPNGKVMISSWAPADGPIEAMYRIVREVVPSLPFQKGQAPLGTEEQIRAEMTEGGLVDVVVEPVTIPFYWDNADAFWEENRRASAPLVATRRTVGEEKWPDVEQRILSALRQALPGAVRIERTAWVSVGRKAAQARA